LARKTKIKRVNCKKCGESWLPTTTGPSKKELIVEFIEKADKKFLLTELAAELSLSEDNLEKALQAFIKMKAISGKIENEYFIKE